MKMFVTLFTAEFKRFWSIGMIAFALVLTGIGLIPSVIMVKAGMITTLSRIIESSDQFATFFTFLIFTAGIISSDIKSGWVRTLLIRPITRQLYLLTKMIVVFSAMLIVMILSITITLIIVSFDPKIILMIDPSASAIITLLKFGQIALLIILSTMVSCGLQGSFNSLFVFAWMTLGQMLDLMVTKKYWDVKWAVVMKEYIFPTGFDDAQKAIVQQMIFPYAEIGWGFASICFFFAVTLYFMNKIVVDLGSE